MFSRQIQELCQKVVNTLNEKGISCYIWHKATTGSCYIRFEDNRIGSIRIGDHDGREKLKYKWNIRTDKHREGWVKDETWRYYVRHTNWQEIIPHIQKRAEQVKEWKQTKFEYNIPKFKQNDTNKTTM